MRTKALLALLGLLAATATTAPSGVTAQTLPTPNFVVIVADDQRADTLEVMPKTLTWFGSQGIGFTNAYATTPLCCPARASIFTGRYAHNHGVQSNRGAEDLDQETTIQYYLQRSGYRTAIFGKFLNKWEGAPPYFDDWALPGSNKYQETTWDVDGEPLYIDEYSTGFLRDQALEFISETETLDAQPWLMFVASQAAHRPYTPEEQYTGYDIPKWERSPAFNERNVSDKPAYVRRKARIEGGDAKRTRRRQLRTLLSVDDLVDSVFAGLEASGELDHTYVFYVSDNGFAWGDHRLLSAGAHKNTPYTSSIHIPLLMYGPTLPTGEVDDRLVANIDIAPTIADLAQVTALQRPGMDGRSLVSDHDRKWLLLEWWKARLNNGIPPWRSLLSDNKQYSEYRRHGRLIDQEYYDLRKDPFQLRNLLGDRRGRNDPNVNKLHERLMEYSTCSGQSCP